MLSHALWTRALAADPAIIGKAITLNGQSVAVVGVAPEGFGGIDITTASFFAPTSLQPVLRPGTDFHRDAHTSWLTIIGRRRDGTPTAQVRAELEVIASQIDREQPGRTTTLSVAQARSLSLPEARSDIFSMAAVVLAAFGLVLLIACANMANLLLARAAGRTKEIAVRLSVGARRGRVIQQLLTESLIIALAGGVVGSMLAWWSFQGLLAFLVSSLPGTVPSLRIDPQPNLTVLTFALALTAATGLVFGLAPALHASKLDLQTLLKGEGTGSGRRSGGWLRGSLIGVQLAVCMVLLISAGLLLRGLYAAQTIRGVTRELAPGLVVGVNRLEENLDFWRTVSRLVAGLSASLSLLALVLASVGVYGVVSYVVSRRLREVVIRMTLGASARDVQSMILRQTLRPVAIGVVIGMAGAAAASKILEGVLFGISPFDPIAFIGAPLFLLGVAAVASLVPTRQALTVDAMSTLRHD